MAQLYNIMIVRGINFCKCFGIMIWFFMIPVKSYATETDTSTNSKLIGVRGHYGFVLIHSRDLRPIEDSSPWGIEIDFGWHLTSRKAWDYCNCYPRAGLSFVFWDFDNRRVLGHGLTLTGYLEPVYFNQKRFNLSFRTAMGVSYESRPYHPETNPDNLSYSTRFAFPVTLNLGFNYKISPYWNVRLAANYNHISNGGIKLPNKGVNYPTASLGMDYTFKPFDFAARHKTRKPPPEKRNRYELTYLMTASNNLTTPNKQFVIWGIAFKFSRHIGRSSALSIGSEFVSDYSQKDRIEKSHLPNRDHKRAAILAGHEFWLGRFVFSQQIGVYYYDKIGEHDPVYHRWGLLFHFTDQFFMGFGLKAHRHVADFLDGKIGVVF